MIAAPLRRQLGIALLAGSTLLAELILTRVLSAGLYHHIAFVVLSTALLGTGVAAVVVSLRAGAQRPVEPWIGPCALGFALSLPVCFATCQWLGAEPLRLAEDPQQILKMGLTYLLLALPFFFAGLSIAALLSAHTQDAPALYGADLIGAAAGSLLGLFAVQLAHGQDALFIASAGAAGSAGMLWASKSSRRWVFGLAAALLLLCVLRLGLSSAPWLPLHISASKVTRGGQLFSKVLRDAQHTRSTRWTPGARVDRVRFSAGQERLIIDAGTAAVRVPPAGFRPAPSDSSLVYELAPQGRFLIIGAGAGWEVAEALAMGASHVDAIELNPAVAAAVPARLRSDPRVNFVVDEGRSYAERAAGPYDAVVMVHTISNAASASGALHLAEDYLFTTEALRQMFALLRPEGFLFVTRPEAQLPRLLNTLRAASEARGPLRARSVVWAERAQANSFYGAVLAAPQPIAAAPLVAIRRRIHDRRGLRLIASPEDPPKDPLFAAIYAQPFDPAIAAARSPSVLTPPTDDRPFFNQRRRLSDLSWRDVTTALSSQGRARMALEDQPIAELSSLIVLVESMVVGTLALLVPILWGRRRQRSGPAPSVLLYFAGLGLGFMLLEVSLIQRLGLLLGAPALSIAVVFTGLLVGAGLGSMAAPRWPRPRWAVLAAAIWSLVLAFLLPVIARYGLAWSSEARIPLAFMISGLTGLALGAPFPLGLQQLRREWVPWAFAVNAFTSVAATVLALLLGAELGFFWVTITAAAAYGLAAASFMSAHSTETGRA